MAAERATRGRRQPEGWMVTLTILAAAGIIVILLYSLRGGVNFPSVVSQGLIVAGTSGLTGGLVGFLFGIPRTLQREDGAAGTEPKGVGYRPNTNLEQISDWLTKILVGIGLIQLGKAPPELQRLAEALAPGFGGGDGSQAFALALVLYFTLSGFLFGFLWARLFLPGAFRTADLALVDERITRRVEELDERITQRVDEQNAHDVRALTLVERQLNPSPDVPPVDEAELMAAVKAASAPVRVQIFQMAKALRNENWRTDPAKMDLVIPVFRALIASDTENRFHRNHGQLGYALKDKRPPDWQGAERELTAAIAIRGDWRTKGWLFYELNRAICRIAQDEMFRQGQSSAPTQRDAILDDLRAAASVERLYSIVTNEPMIIEWLKLNNISLTDLQHERSRREVDFPWGGGV